MLAIVALPALFRSGGPAPPKELERLPQDFVAQQPALFEGPAVVTVWASWCVPCRRELPLFARAAKDFRARRLRVVALNTRDTKAAAQRFLRDIRIDPGGELVVLYDPTGRQARSLRVTGLPTTFFIRPGGRIERRVVGPIGAEELEKQVKRLIPGSSSETITSYLPR